MSKTKIIHRDQIAINRSIGHLKQTLPVWNRLAKQLAALTGSRPSKEDLVDFEANGSLLAAKVRGLVAKDVAMVSSPASKATIGQGLQSQLNELERIRATWINCIHESESVALCDVDKDGTITLGDSGKQLISEYYCTTASDGSIRSIALDLAQHATEAINQLQAFINEQGVSLDAVEEGGPGLVIIYPDEKGAMIRTEYLSMFADEKP